MAIEIVSFPTKNGDYGWFSLILGKIHGKNHRGKTQSSGRRAS